MNKMILFCLPSRGEVDPYSNFRTGTARVQKSQVSTYLFFPISFVGLHLRIFEMKVIVIGVNFVTFFKHLIDAVEKTDS